MTPGEIEGLIRDFVRAGLRARKAGFDGVQIHAAHGYLLSAFLSPHTNRRTDRWGGSPANRARVIVDILKGLKAEAGKDFPVIAKLNTTDFLADGLSLDEAVAAARTLEAEGLDAIEVSGGMAESDDRRTGSAPRADGAISWKPCREGVRIPSRARRDPDAGRRGAVRGRRAGGPRLDVQAFHPRPASRPKIPGGNGQQVRLYLLQ
jgi:2,4-dienoyl-CoA reductase-like NADH-dependent reductase (Old Yellow Enzyme family)